MKRCFYILLAAIALRAQAPTDAEIRAVLIDRIDRLHQNVGIAVGIVDANGRRFVSHGNFSVKDSRPVGNDTVFEIGSTTKVFTSTILADMVQRGEVSLDDPVAKYLPADVKIPQRGGKQITLIDLATHTSGLPRMPANFAPKDPGNPYADYTVANLFQFLSSYELTRDIGSKFEYSNMGVGLLGQALSRRAGMDYEALVRARVTGPLKMENTAIALSPA
jgi:CubicO group peptidase (beta-lactamase class C family)